MSTLNSPERYRGGFNAPEGYFEFLEQRVTARMAVDRPARMTLHRWQKYALPIAASVLLALSSYWVGYQRGQTAGQLYEASAMLDKAALVQYISEQGLLEEYLQQTGYPSEMPVATEWMLKQTTTQDLKVYFEEEYEEEPTIL